MEQEKIPGCKGLRASILEIPGYIPEILGSGTFQERSGCPYLNLENLWNIAECVVGCHRSSNDDMGV